MKNLDINQYFLKTYTDKTYQYPTMVRHQGKVLAFAMDAQRQIYYTLLDMDNRKDKTSELDVNYWAANPVPLLFPAEITQVGYSLIANTPMPTVKKDTRIEATIEELASLTLKERDAFLSSTARLTADAPFQVLSDGQHVYLFRQALINGDADMVYKLNNGQSSGATARTDYVTSNDNKVPLVNQTLLADRFVLAGNRLVGVREIRYRRSRHKTVPKGAKDSLGAVDMEKKPFYEPTQELDFIRQLTGGRFSVMLLPTQVAEIKRWQIFAYNNSTQRIDTVNLERSAEGLFDTRGTQFYTSPDPQYRQSVFEKTPGTCPFTKKPLVPIANQSGHAESCLKFDGTNYLSAHLTHPWQPEAFTVEFWVRAARQDLPENASAFSSSDTIENGSFQIESNGSRRYRFRHPDVSLDLGPINTDWQHLAITYENNTLKYFMDGKQLSAKEQAISFRFTHLKIASNRMTNRLFEGEMDEVRIWNYARTESSLSNERFLRLIGNEPKLFCYWRLDEASGATAYDQTNNARHGTLHNNPTWVTSTAPVGDTNGMRRGSFTFKGRTIAAGMSSLLYHQQENLSSGYGGADKPLKTQARVMLAVPTTASGGADNADNKAYIASVDLGISREGRLAQVPDSLELPEMDNDTNTKLEQISAKGQQLAALKVQLANAPWITVTGAGKASDSAAGGCFGNSVAVSGDVAIIGAYGLDIYGQINPGAAYVFQQDSTGNWRQITKLQASDSAVDDLFGYGVAVSGDVAVIGAVHHDTNGQRNAGAAYVFQRDSAGNWRQITKLQASDSGTDDYFGSGVAVSGDVAVIGASCHDTIGQRNAGAAYVFQRDSAGNWRQITKLQASNSAIAGCFFGNSVAVSGDVAVIGAFGHITNGQSNAGAAYVFQRDSAGNWRQITRLQASDSGTDDYFGSGVAVSGDVAVIGAYWHDTNGQTKAGAAYVFQPDSAGNWRQITKLQASDSAVGDLFGYGVAVSGDVAVIGASCHSTNGQSNAGAAYVFQRDSAGNWRQITRLQASDSAAGDFFGHGVAVSGDVAVIGAYCHDTNGQSNAGAAYFYVPDTSALRAQIRALEAELATLGSNLGSSVVSIMPVLATDMTGLTISGSLSKFAYAHNSSTGTPRLFARADGLLGLYFRGANRQLFSMCYNPRATRARFSLSAGSGKLFLQARTGGREMSGTAITVADGNRTDTCKLTIANTARGITETWNNLPRHAKRFEQALNGEAGKPVYIGTLASAVSGAVTTLGLAGNGLNRALPANATLRVGDSALTADATETNKGATSLTVLSATLTAAADAPVYWIPYDYSQASVKQAQYSLHKGSLLLRAQATTVDDRIANGSAATAKSGQSGVWTAQAPGNSYAFDGSQYLALPDAKHAQLDSDGDTTLEAWIKPGDRPASTIARVVHHHTTSSRYALGICHQDAAYRPFAALGGRFIQTTDTLSGPDWQHLAAVYKQAYALQFDGTNDYLQVDHASTLNVGEDLTIETIIRPDRIDREQLLLGKGDPGRETDVPYRLVLTAGGGVRFVQKSEQGVEEVMSANNQLDAGKVYKIAVIRRKRRDLPGTGNAGMSGSNDVTGIATGGDYSGTEIDKIDDAMRDDYVQGKKSRKLQLENKRGGSSLPTDLSNFTQGMMASRFEIELYINGRQVAAQTFDPANIAGQNRAEVQIGGSEDRHFFHGAITGLRLWSHCRTLEQLHREVREDDYGLVAWWQLEENQGNLGVDSKGGHHAVIKGARWIKDPRPEGSSLTLYVNGSAQQTTALAATDPLVTGEWGDRQFTLGARRSTSGGAVKVVDAFSGELEEVRIWKAVRTQEQILDNVFTRLKEDKQDLLAYYRFDDVTDTEVLDSGLKANNLLQGNANAPTKTLSTAPISDDTAQVRPALAGVETAFHRPISSAPAVAEYGDMQYDADGQFLGVMKRCYGYIDDRGWQLVTGYKVGNLTREWIGQVQFDPQVIGFIEGAPPVPSENMTYGTYEGDGAAVTFSQADDVNYTYSTGRENGYRSSMELDSAAGGSVDVTTMLAPLGFGVGIKIKAEVAMQGHVSFESAGNWATEQGVSSGRNLSRNLEVSLGGNWEDPDTSKQHNSYLGRRWDPANMGIALVQSETADVYALRLKHNNALVSYSIQPNPDIPRDWNLIGFPINPRYIKQGTLDGKIGYRADGGVCPESHYPQAASYGEYSYYKPREAYALKRSIEQERQRLQSYYEHFDASPISGLFADTIKGSNKLMGGVMGGAAGLAALQFTPLGPLATAAAAGLSSAATFSGLGDALNNNVELAKKFAQRNLANTYVWTADGGFYAETTETTDVIQESASGSIGFTSGFGGGVNVEIESPFTFKFEMDASIDANITNTRSRSKEATRTFSLDVSVAPSGDMQYHDPATGKGRYNSDGTPQNVHGRVDAYRFMTFYLDNSSDNFDELYNKVIDPIWLEQSNSANAMALRQARNDNKKPACWRVLHRVTFVSRILPAFDNSAPGSLEKVMQANNINSNWQLIKRLEPFVRDKANQPALFTTAVHNAVDAVLPEFSPHKDDIVRYLKLYYNVGE